MDKEKNDEINGIKTDKIDVKEIIEENQKK